MNLNRVAKLLNDRDQIMANKIWDNENMLPVAITAEKEIRSRIGSFYFPIPSELFESVCVGRFDQDGFGV